MADKPSASEEVVIREYPKSTLWLDGYQVRATGNLILSNRRLIFIRQTVLNEEQVEYLQKNSQKSNTEQLIHFAFALHKKNFQTPLSSIVSARLRFQPGFPFPQSYMRVSYRTAGKNVKTISFRFTVPLFKRLLMSEFPTLDWVRVINKAVKAEQRTGS